jgi:hypothetical protein
LVKKIAVYGAYEDRVPVKQRYWIKRKDGVKQRYWKVKRGCFKKVIRRGRYEFHGTGKDLYKSVLRAFHLPPKGYIDVPAERFLRDPTQYGHEDVWVQVNVESG